MLIWKELAAKGYDLSCYIENELVTFTGALHGIETNLTERGPGAADRMKIHELLGAEAYTHKQRYYSVLEHILKMPRDRPFLLLVWFLDPHTPYRPPREETADIAARYRDLANDIEFYRNLMGFDIKDMGTMLSDKEARLLRELYRGEVESVDSRIGNIIRALKHTERLDDTYLVLTSDHGEAFGEHGRFCHGGPEFYDELIHVPLIIAGPGLPEGMEITDPVSHIQIIPTLRALLDLEPGSDLEGQNLVEPAEPEHKASAPIYLSGISGAPYAVIDGDWKLMVNGADLTLFNLADDPGERTNIYGRFPGISARLSEIGARITAENLKHREAVEVLSETEDIREAEAQEIKKTMRSLGYIR